MPSKYKNGSLIFVANVSNFFNALAAKCQMMPRTHQHTITIIMVCYNAAKTFSGTRL